MKQQALKVAVRYQVVGVRARLRTREALEDERGEVGSWMIVAAGLAAAAVSIVSIVGPWLVDQANAITGGTPAP